MTRFLFDRRDLGDDLRRWFSRHDIEWPADSAAEYSPPMDVVETSGTVEIVMDLPGVDAGALKIVFTQGLIVVTGMKTLARCRHHQAAFHLAERSFGRFARAVRLTGAFDASRASATLEAGELRMTLPRIEERRGKELRIPVTAR